MKKIIFLILLGSLAHAKEGIQLGTFSLATEAGWGAAFELQKNGIADVIPSFDGENEDGSTNPKPKMNRVKATWKETKEGIEIAYSGHRDLLKLEKECRDWPEYPCFRFQKALEGLEDKSLTKFTQPYINWDWKNPSKSKVPANSHP